MSRLFALARRPTPLLNTPHFRKVFGGHDGKSLVWDEQRLIRSVEMVAFPETKFQLHERVDETTVRVTSMGYHGHSSLFADLRFLEEADPDVPERALRLPPASLIYNALESALGSVYLWGGNWPGIPEMLTLFPASGPLDPFSHASWTFHGFDCSGILYYATGGSTPRNTSELLSFGKGVPIEGKKIWEVVQPLDLIVWRGHVILVYDSKTTIESLKGTRPIGAVIKSDLKTRLEEILLERKPLNAWQEGSHFVVRRFLS